MSQRGSPFFHLLYNSVFNCSPKPTPTLHSTACHNWYRTHRIVHSAWAHMRTVSRGKIHLMLRNNFMFQSRCFSKQFLDTVTLYGHIGSLGACDQALEASHFCQYYLYRQLQIFTDISRANSVLTSSEKLTHSQMTDRVQYRHSFCLKKQGFSFYHMSRTWAKHNLIHLHSQWFKFSEKASKS